MTQRRMLLLPLLFWLLAGAHAAQAPAPGPAKMTKPPPSDTPPAPPREFRGAWAASVDNIDWPSKPGLTTEQQQRELIALLDRAAALHLNAVVLQVRPACDALYPSPYEPWSEYLTGRQGQAPVPFYDPLAFAVAEAHRRGLELHAWFNPFRARHDSAKGPLAPTHVAKTHPQWVKTYGGLLWLDPGEPGVQEYSLAVILDVVRRYDIDGVHIDDYFYPYPAPEGHPLPFPDDASWKRYRQSGGRKSRGSWRRDSVNHFVERLYAEVKGAKPWVKVGISPFGIYRPGQPKQIKGFDAYSELYADSRLWLDRGWLDYLSPQLYWKIEKPAQSFPVLLHWWVAQNKRGRHMWPGLYTSRILPQEDPKDEPWPASEIVYQVKTTRGMAGATGDVHFSMKALLNDNAGLGRTLQAGLYAQPALVPASPWLDNAPPAAPIVAVWADPDTPQRTLTWQPTGSEPAWLWAVQARTAGVWTTQILPGARTSQPLPGGTDRVAVSAVDRCGNRSEPTVQAVAK